MSRIIQCTCLENWGRFGNMCFIYSFAKAYAEKYNAVLEVPENWIGRKIFKVEDPPISKKLRKTQLDLIPWGEVNIDLFGYFQFEKCFNIMSISKIREWLQFQDHWKFLFPKKYEYYITWHLRRGDYQTKYNHIYCVIDREAYKKATRKFGYNLNYVVEVSDDFPNEEDYPNELSFLPDFFMLMNADVLFRANSTFSLWASILGDVKTYSPIVEGKTKHQKDIDFVLGNHPKILADFNGASPQKPSDFIFLP